MIYEIFIDDNYHYMDESERIKGKTYITASKALAAAQQIVDDCLRDLYRNGLSSGELYDLYVSSGKDPFIITSDDSCKFSAWDYAKSRCQDVCKEMAD